MTVFYCDLDNTLIYSHQRDIGPSKVGVERYQGKEISFMTQTSVALLEQVREQVLFIPTTTRTPEQYGRVRLGQEPPDYALVCNGGILLRNGIRDDLWYQQSLSLIAPCLDELARAEGLLREDVDRSFELRFLHGLFLYTKSANPPQTIRRLRARVDTNQLAIFSQGAKVYVLPIQLTKAHAVARLNQMLGTVSTLAAGDSPMDAGMLEAADMAFAPENLAKTMKNSKNLVEVSSDHIFSDIFLQLILKMD